MTTVLCSMPGCPNRDRPVHDQAYVCAGCARVYELQLGDVPALLGELDTTRVRLARIGDPGGGSGDRPPPWHEKAAVALVNLQNTITTLARHISDTRGRPVPLAVALLSGPPCAAGWCAHPSCRDLRGDAPTGHWAAAAVWLLGHVEWLRHRPEGPEWMLALGLDVERARRVIDRQADRWYAGPCGEPTDAIVGGCSCQCHGAGPGTPCDMVGGCGLEWHRPVRCPGELYARPGADFVDCPACGAQFDVKARREWLLNSARDALAGAALIGALLADPDRPGDAVKLAARIRKWAERGRLVPHSYTPWGRNDDESEERLHPRYRVGDVQDLLAAAAVAVATGKACA